MVETTYAIPGLPGRIAHLSDLHNVDPAPILARVEAWGPELICFSGDLLDGTKPRDVPPGEKKPLLIDFQPHVLPFLRGCAAIAPTFVSLGNHDRRLGPASFERMAEAGVTVLDNASAATELRGRRLVIGGQSSSQVTMFRKLWERYGTDELTLRQQLPLWDPAPDTAWLRDFAAADGYRLLLCHHPEYYPLLPEGIDLILSGHAHGGQWRYYSPLRRTWQGLYAPGQGLFPRRTGGFMDGRQVISRGLAEKPRLPRFNNPTEIVFLTPAE